MSMATNDGLVQLELLLDFPAEQMSLEVLNDMKVSDDGSEHGARQIVSAIKFTSDYICNGKLQIHNADTGELLGWKSAYLPVNISPGHARDHFNEMIAKYEAEAQIRAVANR